MNACGAATSRLETRRSRQHQRLQYCATSAFSRKPSNRGRPCQNCRCRRVAPSTSFFYPVRMTDCVGSQLDPVLKRVEALYRCDQRGRLVSVNQWNGGAVPRFYLMRTAESAVCRFRADLPDDLVRRLEELSTQEPKDAPPGRLPALYSQYLDLLTSHAPVERIWAGPAYMSTRDVSPDASPMAIGDNNAHLLRRCFEDWLPDVPHRQPFMAMIEDDHAVSICASVRISDAVHCAGVETHVAHRQRGHAVNAVAGWAIAVRSLGATPFYSTSWENDASRRVAARLQLSLMAADFHVT